MRCRTMLATAIVAVAVTGSVAAGPALANGGAYVEFDGSHHLVGDQVRGTVAVSIPDRRRELLERGPFHAYLLPGGTAIVGGRPVPAGAIRVGTFEVEPTRAGADLTIAFTVPDVTGDYYELGLCNEPCTVAGFAEAVSGTLSIVATPREAALLTDVARGQARIVGLRREVRRSTREAEEAAAGAASSLERSESSGRALAERVATLEAKLASARADVEATSDRIEPWGALVAAIAAAALAVAVVALARKVAARSPAGAAEPTV